MPSGAGAERRVGHRRARPSWFVPTAGRLAGCGSLMETPAPCARSQSEPHDVLEGTASASGGWGFYVRDWLNVAYGEGGALIIALAAGFLAALSLAERGARTTEQEREKEGGP